MTIFLIALRPIDAFLNQSPVFRVNPLQNTFHRGLGGSVISVNSERLVRPEHLSCGEIAAEAAGQAQSLRFGQVGCAAMQFFFCFFALVDIRNQVIPTNNAPFGITLRTRSKVEPTVHSIGSTATSLQITRLPSCDGPPIGFDHARKVIRMDGVAGGPILQFLSGLAEVFQDLAVDKFDLACRIRGRHKPRNTVDDQAQTLLIRSESVLSALPVVNIRQQVVPTDDPPVGIALRETAGLKPSIGAIGPTEPMLNLVCLTGFYGAAPIRRHPCAVIWMQKRGPLLQFRKSLAEVTQHLLINEFDLAVFGHRPDKARNSIDNLPKVLFARAERIFSPLPVVNVSQHHVPVGDLTFCVSRGESARLEPAVNAVGTPLAKLQLIRFPRLDRVSPHLDHARKVIRMDSIARRPILQVPNRLSEEFQDSAI